MLKVDHWSEAVIMQKNMYKFVFKDLGNISYKDAWEYQENLFQEVISLKINKQAHLGEESKSGVSYLLFCEHPHVYTLGKSGKAENLLVNIRQLEATHAEFFRTNRGGDITYHGPGQIVAYPIFDLEQLKLSLLEYVHLLEETVIQALEPFGVKGDRLKGATGVWLDPLIPSKTRKICAIGVRASRYVTMHGLALNVNTDLSRFDLINPCGFKDKTVTSIEKETCQRLEINQVKDVLKNKFAAVFGIDFYPN